MGSTTANNELQQLVLTMQANQYAMWAALALTIYDAVLAVPRELSLFVHKRRKTASMMLLLCSRWSTVAFMAIVIAPLSPKSNCTAVVWVQLALNYLAFTLIAAFSSIRVFALWDRHYVFGAIVFVLGVVPVAVNLYVDAFRSTCTFVGWPVNTCVQSLNLSDRELAIWLHVSRGSAVAMDAFVLVLTWLKTFSTWRAARRVQANGNLTGCLLRDGTWFFFGLLALNIADMTTYTEAVSPLSSYMMVILPSVLMNRFLVNLISANDGGAPCTTTDGWPLSLRFAAPAQSAAADTSSEDIAWTGVGARAATMGETTSSDYESHETQLYTA